MNSNYEPALRVPALQAPAPQRQTEGSSEGEPIGALDLLAASGVEAEIVYEGDGHGCPHCASQVLPEAA